jgi:transcriptional regulator with XRE-family HTH domain
MTWYLRIAQLADQKEWNQLDLAERTGLNPGTINRYWRNQGRQVDIDVLTKIADALGISMLDLFTEEVLPPPPKRRRKKEIS